MFSKVALMKRWFVIASILLASTAHAKVITEASALCEPQFIARIDESKILRVVAQCVTIDSTGAEIRKLEKEITNRLTAAQLNGALAILGRINAVVAESENIPTPVSTPTAAVAITPTTLVTP